jgi:hypothetical protein
MGVAGVALAGYVAYKAHQARHKADAEASRLKREAQRPYEELQYHLPPELRMGQTGPLIGAGMEGIGSLIRNPGQLSSAVSSSVAPGVGMESQGIAQQFRNEATNQAGAAGANNLSPAVKAMLQQILGTSQEGAQRGARTKGLGSTDQLKRQDLDQTYKLLDTIMQFIASGRGQTIPGLIGAAENRAQNYNRSSTANLASLASLLQGLGQRPAPQAGG